MNCAVMDRVCQAQSRDGDDGAAEFTHSQRLWEQPRGKEFTREDKVLTIVGSGNPFQGLRPKRVNRSPIGHMIIILIIRVGL